MRRPGFLVRSPAKGSTLLPFVRRFSRATTGLYRDERAMGASHQICRARAGRILTHAGPGPENLETSTVEGPGSHGGIIVDPVIWACIGAERHVQTVRAR